MQYYSNKNQAIHAFRDINASQGSLFANLYLMPGSGAPDVKPLIFLNLCGDLLKKYEN